jgi:hypothetical protein
MINAIFDQFVEASPVSVMVRGIMERIFEPKALDDLFERTATQQYTKELLFSTVVGLMSLVVSGIHPSVSAAYKALEKVVGVSRPALYGKLNGMEPGISQALVRHSVENLKPVMAQFQLEVPERLPGYPIRIADGNHLGATEHRLEVLRHHRSGALPGQLIAVLDPQQQLVLDVFPCEDGHAQERSLFTEVLQTVHPQEVWIADRNFCTRSFLCGIAQQQAYFVVREHQNLPWQALTLLVEVGATETGKVFEQQIQITDDVGGVLEMRRVVIQLEQPTRHGDREVSVLTNLPTTVANAMEVTKLYLERWSIEGMFQVITDTFHCELNSLGYPRAALFVFCIAVMSFNILSTVKAALKTVHGVAKIESGLSDYYLVEEVQGTFRGMMIALPSPLWQPWREMNVEQCALMLEKLAAGVNLKRFSSAPRGRKKAKPKPVFDPKHPHVSTARLLEEKKKGEKKNKRSP